MPARASLSSCGVLIVEPCQPTSPHPRSSATMSTKLGREGDAAKTAVGITARSETNKRRGFIEWSALGLREQLKLVADAQGAGFRFVNEVLSEIHIGRI